MPNIKLNKKQITELIKYKKTLLSNNIAVEVYNNELIYNDNGVINYITSLNLTFKRSAPQDNYIQQLICNHFHIHPHNVIINQLSPEDAEFIVRFTPNSELYMIVCPITTAIRNALINNDQIENATTASFIGPYRRLGDSCYFFRWDSDINSAQW